MYMYIKRLGFCANPVNDSSSCHHDSSFTLFLDT